jgi:peptidoglycan/xylan/chitin deacetylase (PgdA/CDA1 family)
LHACRFQLKDDSALNGVFTISLDFELHWGGFEKWELGGSIPETRDIKGRLVVAKDLRLSGVRSGYRQYFLNTRLVIPEMLRAFEKYQVHVTWAAVGLLFHETRQELIANMPFPKPSLHNEKLSAYHYIDTVGIGESETDDPFHYGLSLIRKIKETPYQEIGSHTFAHYYACEEGQTMEQFRADLQAAQRAAQKHGIRLRSLVFPRNQINDAYLRVCYEEGFRAVRTNPSDWFWQIGSTQSESPWKRLNRGLDAYFNTGNKKSYSLSSVQVRDGEPVCFPASRLLRPFGAKELFLNDLKIGRILSEMEQAARNNEVYHLWWHPHNFGLYPHQNMEGLLRILNQFDILRDKYGMESYSMGALADRLMVASEAELSTGT